MTRGRCNRATESAKGALAAEATYEDVALGPSGRPSLGDRQVLTLSSDSSFKVTERL